MRRITGGSNVTTNVAEVGKVTSVESSWSFAALNKSTEAETNQTLQISNDLWWLFSFLENFQS